MEATAIGLGAENCGVSHRIIDDIYDRFLIFVTQHNQQQKHRWEQKMATQSSP